KWHIAADRTRVYGRGGSARWSKCRGTHVPAVGTPFCSRSSHRWKNHQARWNSLHRNWCNATKVPGMGADLYLPLGLDPASTHRSARDLTVSGVRKRGISREQTEPFLQDLARRVETGYVAANPEYAGLVYEPYDVRAGVVGDLRVATYVLMGAVALLLL